jgi:hypothetical protein
VRILSLPTTHAMHLEAPESMADISAPRPTRLAGSSCRRSVELHRFVSDGDLANNLVAKLAPD